MDSEEIEVEEISVAVLIFLAEGRSQLYDSYASNALTLFGIEIAVLPIAFAVASVITSAGLEIELDTQNLPIVSGTLLLGLVCYISAIGLTGNVYKKAKRSQFEYLDVVRDVYYRTFKRENDFDQIGPLAEEFRDTAESRRDSINNIFYTIQEKIPGSEYEPPPVEKRLREEFGGPGSAEYEFYTKLRLSIWLTLSATFLLVSAVLATAGRGYLAVSIAFGGAAIMLAIGLRSYVPALPIIVYNPTTTVSGLLSYGVTFIWPGLILLLKYIATRLKAFEQYIRSFWSND